MTTAEPPELNRIVGGFTKEASVTKEAVQSSGAGSATIVTK